MNYDGRAIANHLLDVADKEGIEISNLALQKILFFCHVWNLVDTGEPLIKNQFEAWQHGPVLQYLYRQFRSNESAPIKNRATGLNASTGAQEIVKCDLPDSIKQRLSNVLNFYGRLKPWDLVDLSHVSGGPWDKVWNHEGKVNPGMKIQNEVIQKFYSKAVYPEKVQ